MYRLLLVCSLGSLAYLPAAATAGENKNPSLKSAQAFQEVLKKVIDDADPSIACVLVSRSDAYQRFGLGPSADHPGRLGGYDPGALDQHPLLSKLAKAERDKVKQKLDLADPDNQPEAYGSGVIVD